MSEIANSNDTSSHAYAGLEKADTNSASWFDFREIDATEDFDSESDWRKTHKRTYYQHLDHQNRGYANGVRRNKPFYTYQSNLHLSEALSSTLGLRPTQASKAKLWFRRLDFQKLGHPSEVSGFCICAWIVHETERDQRKCHPQSIEEWPAEFTDRYGSWSSNYQNRVPNAYGQVDHRIRNWSTLDNSPASKPMDTYGCYEGQLHHRTEPAQG